MSLITPFDPWQSPLCTCRKKYSLSAYTGCSHGCLYCYASSYIRGFSSPRPKKDFLSRLEKEIKKMPADSTITISNSSDPYQPLEEKLRLTRSALEIMKDYEINLLIVTKSDLVTRDVDILQKFKKKVIAITLTTIDPALAGKLEPGAASPQKRLAAIKKLSGMIPIILRLDPLVYPLNTSNLDGIIKEAKLAGVKQIVTSTYKAKADNFKRMVKAFPEHSRLWNDLYIKEGKKRSNYLYLAKSLREKLIKKVRDIALAQGLEFSSCREGFSELNTAACDGSSWL